MSTDQLATMLFRRRYDRYSGGHQKVLDYFQHVLAHPEWQPEIYWAQDSMAMPNTIWAEHAPRRAPEYQPSAVDGLFLAGMDWVSFLKYRSESRLPIINLIQGVRHGDPAADVYPFLTERAIRICVSEEVEAAILATGRVEGPTFVIPNGIEVASLSNHFPEAVSGRVYILGNKQPVLAKKLADALSANAVSDVVCHLEHTPHAGVLAAMTEAEIAILLPSASEGFYLPPLEAMALGALTIVPDCVGNRGFCHNGSNCLMPELSLYSLLASVEQARGLLLSGESDGYRAQGQATVSAHSLERECATFHDILDNLDQIL